MVNKIKKIKFNNFKITIELTQKDKFVRIVDVVNEIKFHNDDTLEIPKKRSYSIDLSKKDDINDNDLVAPTALKELRADLIHNRIKIL